MTASGNKTSKHEVPLRIIEKNIGHSLGEVTPYNRSRRKIY
jgi:hypothetical protein